MPFRARFFEFVISPAHLYMWVWAKLLGIEFGGGFIEQEREECEECRKMNEETKENQD